MGGGSWTPSDWASYSSTKSYDTKRPEEVINTRDVNPDFLPKNFKNGIRESCDSTEHPNSTPIALFGDTTGSMGRYAGLLIKEGMAKFVTEVHDRKIVTDPQIMCGAISDVAVGDPYPIQATQYESDLRLIQQLEQIYVTGGGGGNNSESYHLPWVLAARMTKIDSFLKRGIKGVLFSYGDEETPEPLTPDHCKRALGLDIQTTLTAQQALAMALETYDVYHLVILEGSYARSRPKQTINAWTDLLGQRAIPVEDSTKMAEIMVSILEVTRQGKETKDVAKTWSGDTSLVVAKAIDNLTPMLATGGASKGLVTL